MIPDEVERPRKPGSEGLPWSDPESDPLADLRDTFRRMASESNLLDIRRSRH